MKANVKRPARFSFKTITEKKAKHLTLIFVAVLFLVIVVLALFPLLDREEERYEVTTYAMGSYVQQTVYGENREDAAVKAADAVEALEQKISWRVANSDIQKLNNNAGKDWVTLSDETLNVLTQAQSVSEKSGGAFDVTIAPISRLWDFDDELNEVPDSDLITSLLPYVNYSLLRIDETEQTASLKNLGIAVDLGSVGKGAACDAAGRAYEEAGAKAAIIAVGGSVGVYGEKSSGKPWSVAVRDPNGDGSLGSVTLAEGFVSTSGSYEKYFEQDGVFGGDDALQFARRIGRENHACRVAAHARYADELAEQFALGLRREAEKELRVLAHDEMGEELHLAPAFDFRIGLQRNMEQVAHSAGFDDGVGGRQFGELPLDIFVHSFREIV